MRAGLRAGHDAQCLWLLPAAALRGWQLSEPARGLPAVNCPEGYESIRGQCAPPCQQGFVRNPNNPLQCERIPNDEPDCPEGTKLNPQTNECERVPPPPPPTVKCKQGLEYNPKTKQCEPPPRVETTCPKGFTKLKNGKCQRIVEQPPEEQGCPRNFVLNRNTGECEPIRLNVPKACPEGTEFSRKRQRCVPVFNQQEPEFEPKRMMANRNCACRKSISTTIS